MAVVVASAPKFDTHVSDASYGYSNGHGYRNGHGYSNGHLQTSLSSYSSSSFDSHHGAELRCSKCSCLPLDCQCVESRPVGPAYCPNPNQTDLPKEYETHVQILQRVPEMQEVEETYFEKKVVWEKAKVRRQRCVLTYHEVEQFETVPVVKYVTRTRQETVYHVSEEEREIHVTEQCVESKLDWVVRQKRNVITEEVEEEIIVPVVKDDKVTRMCEEWTGKYCESEVEQFCSPGDFNLICEDSSGHGGYIRKSRSASASSVSGGDSPSHQHSATKLKKTQSMTDHGFKAPKKSHSMIEDNLKAVTT